MVQDEYGILPLRLDSWFNCKVKEFGLEQILVFGLCMGLDPY